MALPTKSDVSTLAFSLDGSPWQKVAAKPGIELDTLEYSLDGSPWYGLEDAATVGIKTWNGISIANVKTINGVAIANIKTINGIPL